MHFIGWEILFGKNIAEFYFWGSNCKQVSTGPGNGLAPNRQQAIIWTKAERVLWHHKASKGHNDLRFELYLPEINELITNVEVSPTLAVSFVCDWTASLRAFSCWSLIFFISVSNKAWVCNKNKDDHTDILVQDCSTSMAWDGLVQDCSNSIAKTA